MLGVDCIVLFSFSFMFFPCEGAVYPPLSGNNMTLLSGSTAKIKWRFDDAISDVRYRSWAFTSVDGSFKGKALADITGNGSATILKQFPVIEVEKPSTLVLKNVDRRYVGKYKFQVVATSSGGGGGGESEFTVYIYVTPNITFNRPNLSTVNEGDNLICLCKGEGGYPTPDVIWYDKNGDQIGLTGKGEQLLNLTEVNVTHSGIYTCKAQSHINATRVKLLEVKVRLNYKPRNTNLTVTSEEATVGESVTFTCESDGLPEPSYAIFHNGSLVTLNRKLIISNVNYIHAGTYKCLAQNKLGSDSASANLTVAERKATTQPIKSTTIQSTESRTNMGTSPPPAATTTKSDGSGKVSKECNSKTEWYIIFVAMLSGIIIGILLSFAVFLSRRKFRSRKPQDSNLKPPTSQLDSTYQELDLKKMSTEDNYQSLRGNAARNDGVNNDESNYTELNKTRDVENNYQSLT